MSPSGPFDLHPITSPATGARGPEALPDDLAEEAAGRLRMVALIMAGLWGIGITVNHLIFPYLDLRPEQIVPWTPVSDLVGLMSIALSAAVYSIAPRAARDLEQLATIAIAYEVAVAFGIGVVNQWHPVALAGRLSWICVVVLLFPLLVPGIHPDGAGRLVPGRVHGPSRHPDQRARAASRCPRCRWSRGPISRITSAPCWR